MNVNHMPPFTGRTIARLEVLLQEADEIADSLAAKGGELREKAALLEKESQEANDSAVEARRYADEYRHLIAYAQATRLEGHVDAPDSETPAPVADLSPSSMPTLHPDTVPVRVGNGQRQPKASKAGAR